MKIKVLTTPTCIKCKSLKPILEKVSNDTNIECEFLNALENTDMVKSFGVMSVPFIIVYNDDDEVVTTYNEVITEKGILSVINKYNNE